MRKGNTTLELYDLKTDPSESADLAPNRRPLIGEIESLLRSARTVSHLFPIKVLDEQH